MRSCEKCGRKLGLSTPGTRCIGCVNREKFKPCANPACGKMILRKAFCSTCQQRLRETGSYKRPAKPVEVVRGRTTYVRRPDHRLADQQGWVRKAMVVAEEATGKKLPKSARFVYRDGNPLNLTPENILVRSKRGKLLPLQNSERIRKRATPRRLTPLQVLNARLRRLSGESIDDLCTRFQLTTICMTNLLAGRTYRDVPYVYDQNDQVAINVFYKEAEVFMELTAAKQASSQTHDRKAVA